MEHERESDDDERLIDVRLIGRIAAGERAALKEFHDKYRNLVFTIGMRVCGQECDAEAVLVTVFWEIWKNPSGWNPQRGSARTYLLLLTRSRARDLMRSELSRRAAQQKAQTELQIVGKRRQSDLDPSDPVIDTTTALRLRETFGTLPDELREALGLAFFSGLTHVEVADRLQIPLGTVKTRIRRGLTRMRKHLSATKDDWSIP